MKFFGKNKYENNLLIDIGSSTIKFLVTTGKYPETMSVLDYRLVNIESKKNSNLIEELQEIIKHTYQSLSFKPNKAKTLIQPQQEVVRVVELPDVEEDELKKAAGYQLNRYVPFARDEAIYECYPISGLQPFNGMRKCVLVAVRRNNVEKHLKLFEPSNIIPVVINVEAVAIMNSYIAVGSEFNNKKQIEEKENIALVHIGASHTSFSVLGNKIPIASRSINIGSNSMIKDVVEYLNVEPLIAVSKLSDENKNDVGLNAIIDSFVTNLSLELKASLSYCQREFGIGVEHIYVTGGCANNKIIIQELETIIKLPIYQFNVFDFVDLSRLSNAVEDFNKNALTFVPLFALAIEESFEE